MFAEDTVITSLGVYRVDTVTSINPVSKEASLDRIVAGVTVDHIAGISGDDHVIPSTPTDRENIRRIQCHHGHQVVAHPGIDQDGPFGVLAKHNRVLHFPDHRTASHVGTCVG